MIESLGDNIGMGTAENGLNDVGEVVGVTSESSVSTAPLFHDGQVIPLPGLDGNNNWAEEIYNQGLAVGIASQPNPGPWPYDAEAVLWDTRTGATLSIHSIGKMDGTQA